MGIEYAEEETYFAKPTRKQVWNPESNEWETHSVWRLKYERSIEDWLKEQYPNMDGWGTAFTNSIILMEERVFVHYRLSH